MFVFIFNNYFWKHKKLKLLYMNYWLIKTEPDAYSWEKFVTQGRGVWDGVRNF